MNEAIIEATERLKKIFPNKNDQITFIDDRGDGHHFTLEVISDAFTDRPLISRQRMIYDQLNDLIQSNSIHALRMNLQTHAEIEEAKQDPFNNSNNIPTSTNTTQNPQSKPNPTPESNNTPTSSPNDSTPNDSSNSSSTPSPTTSSPVDETSTSSPAHPEHPHHHLHILVNKHPIMIFMKGDRLIPQCGFSAQIIELLDEYETTYETFDILEDEDIRQDLKEFSNWPTYPQIYIKGELLGGLDITQDLHEKGELEKILDQVKENY